MKTQIRICVCLAIFVATSYFAFFAVAKKSFEHPAINLAHKKNDFAENTVRRKTLPVASTDCSVTLSGNSCVGSELSVVSNSPVESISWLLNGVSIFDQSNAKQNNGQVVAGGNGIGSAANQLYNPNRLFVDRDGTLYIPDMANNRVQKWAKGAISGITIAGGNGSGSNSNQFNRPTAVTVDLAGNLYVVDQNNSRVQKWSSGAAAGVTIASFLNTPTGIFIDDLGNLYVSEQNGQTVRKYTGAAGTGTIVAGGNGYGNGANQLAAPTGLFVDRNQNIYIADTDNNRVQKWAPGARFGTTVARTNGNPLGVFVDNSNNIYVSDYTGYAVQKWLPAASSGIIIAGGNGPGSNPNQIQPAGVWMDAHNNLYVSDFLNGRVIKFSNIYTGTYTTLKAGTYTAKITTKDGCVITSNAIEVKDNLIPKIVITADKNVVCTNNQPTFTAAVQNAGNAPVIQWKINGIAVNGEHNLSFIPKDLKATDNVTCDLTNLETCVAPTTVKSNNLILNTPITETPAITIASDFTTNCEGSSFIFKANTSFAGNNPTYRWQVNHLDVFETSDTFKSETLQNNDVVSCIVTSNAQNCQTTPNATSNEIKVQINPILMPTISIASDITDIYTTSKVNFTAQASNAGQSPSYQWFLNGIPVGDNSNRYTASNLKQNDLITCELQVNTPCVSASKIFSNAININIIKVYIVKPPNAFTPNGDNVNDVWQIEDLKAFPKCTVSIFNRHGSRIFYSIGYDKPWGGDRNNTQCAPGVYYYTINLDGKKVISGSVSIIK